MNTSTAKETLKVRGLIITAPKQVSLQQFDLHPPKHDYARVRVEACGLCTWEQRVYKGTRPSYPFWGGHEVCGTIEELSVENATDLKCGERVAVALMRRCGQCHSCKRGLDNHCVYVQPEPLALLPQGPRGLSNQMYVPLYQVFPLNPELSFGEGALVEPTACVLRSIEKANITQGAIAVVLGGGTMGIIHTVLLRMKGCRVIVCEDDVENHHAIGAAGASFVLPLTSDEGVEEVLRITNGKGADALFCTRGGTKIIERAVRMATRGGRIVLFQSLRGPDEMKFSANDLHYREIQILGTISQTIIDFQHAADLVSVRPGLFSSLVTQVIKAEYGQEAFERALDPHIHRVLVAFS